MTRRWIVVLVGLAIFWSLSGCSASAHSGLMAVEFMKDPPPLARFETGSHLRPLVVDWAAVDKAVSVRAPKTLVWATTSDEPTVLVLHTQVVPIRVISLNFATVDSAGIPRGDGREQVCDFRQGQIRQGELTVHSLIAVARSSC